MRARAALLLCLCLASWQAHPAALACRGQAAASPLCVELKQATDARDRAEALRGQALAITAPPWPPGRQRLAEEAYEEGGRLFEDEYFGDAALYFSEAAALYEELLALFAPLRQGKEAEAAQALAQHDFDQALALYQELLAWQQKPEYTGGIAKARAGMEDQALVAQARQALAEGDAHAANQSLSQLTTDLFAKEKQALAAELEQLRQSAIAKQKIGAAYKLLDQGKLDEARAGFEEALALSPDAAAAKDGLQETAALQQRQSLAALGQALRLAEQAEAWQAALDAINQLQALQPEGSQYLLRQTRYQAFADYEKRLDHHLANPARHGSKKVRQDIASLLAEFDGLDQPGGKLLEKHAQLSRAFAQATEKQQLVIQSNKRTEVLITPGRSLGRFEEMVIAVIPGRYQLRGRRKGYREVVKEIEVAADAAGPLVVEIIADRKF